jgi:ligand-binding sensor domain-containing protein
MRLYHSVCVFAIVCVSTVLRAGDSYFFRHFTEKDGLSSDQVTCVLQASNGYLWVGTNYGLNRYDGYAFKQYLPASREPERTVSHEYIMCLAEDDEGGIWIATRQGLNRYDPITDRFQVWQSLKNGVDELPNSLIHSVLVIGDQVWLACDNRDLAVLDRRAGTWATFHWKEAARANVPLARQKDYLNIDGLSPGPEGHLWLNTNVGLFDFDLKRALFTARPSGSITTYSATKDACTGNSFWGSWNHDVLVYNPCKNTWRNIRLPLQQQLNDGFRRVYQVSAKGRERWVLTEQGVFLLDTDNGRIRSLPAETTHAPFGAVQVLFEAPNGSCWLGGTKGLWHLDTRLQHFQYQPLDTAAFASYYNRYAGFLDLPRLQRRLILDLYRGQLLVEDAGRWQRTIALGGVAKVLKRSKNGQIWVSGGQHLYQLDSVSLSLRQFPLPVEVKAAHTIVDFATDAQGDYWLAVSQLGLFRFSQAEQRWQRFTTAQGFEAHHISCIAADEARQVLWVGTFDLGLYRYDHRSGRFTLYQHAPNSTQTLSGYMVRALLVSQGYLWIGTDQGGVSRFDYEAAPERAFTHLSTENGLPSNQVCGLIADRKGRIWAGTTKGLACINSTTLAISNWTQRSGLRQDMFDLPLGLGADGSILLGEAKGYCFFQPESLLTVHYDGRIHLQTMQAMDRVLPLSDPLVLSWRDNLLSLTFGSAELSMPEKNEFAVQLIGFDPKPRLSKVPNAVWTNLVPGQYTISIHLVREGKVVAGGFTRVLTIVPPFWQRWWFRLLAGAALLALLAFIYQYRMAQVRRVERLNADFERRMAQVEMTALRAQMNPHFVFNSLNSINRFILMNDSDAASAYLTKFSRLMRFILEHSRSDMVSLEHELEALRLYIELEMLRFDGRFDFQLAVAPDLNPAQLDIPPMLIQPYIENAIWHGLMQKKGRGQLWLRCLKRKNGWCVEIEDDGIGRAQANSLRSKSVQPHKSYGMQLNAERIQMMQQAYGVSATLGVEDKTDAEGRPLGTKVTLFFNEQP